ncbi:hypothetical protein IWZ01DRAFT_553430, partial [Phyllosticta capitalensis]
CSSSSLLSPSLPRWPLRPLVLTVLTRGAPPTTRSALRPATAAAAFARVRWRSAPYASRRRPRSRGAPPTTRSALRPATAAAASARVRWNAAPCASRRPRPRGAPL